MSDNELAVHETHDVFESYDLADEEQIIAEMSGRVTDKYVYTFKQGGQDVTGLSFAGTNWAVREYAKQGEVIRIVGRPEIMLDPTDHDHVIVVVTAQRFAVQRDTGKEIALDSTIGVKRQGKMMEKKKYADGELVGKEMIIDPFFIEKAVSKAIRNAKQALIPTDIVKKLISRALESKNGKSVSKGQQGQQNQQPPQGQQRQQNQAPPQQQQARPIQTPPTSAPVQPPPPQQQQKPIEPPPPVAPPAPSPVPPPAPAPVQQAAPPPPPVQRPAPPPAAPAPAPAAPASTAPPPAEMSKDVMVQKLDAVLKVVYGTQDSAVARGGLAMLTGFSSPADMPMDKMKQLGNTLNMVVKKQARVQNNQIVRIQDNVVLWQGPEIPVAAPGTEPMF